MDREILEQAANLAYRVGHVFVATADIEKVPYLAIARKLSIKDKEQIMVDGWYSPGTAKRFRSGSSVYVVIWDRYLDRGFQLSGDTLFNREKTINAENELHIAVRKAVDFTRFPQTEEV